MFSCDIEMVSKQEEDINYSENFIAVLTCNSFSVLLQCFQWTVNNSLCPKLAVKTSQRHYSYTINYSCFLREESFSKNYNKNNQREVSVSLFNLYTKIQAPDQPIKYHCCPHVKTGHLIYTTNQWTGPYIRATVAFNGLK